MLAILEDVAVEAGKAIMAVYRAGPTVTLKADSSPVTEADRRAEEIILRVLRRQWPDIPVVAEEEISAGHVPGDLGKRFFLVDPLDGTREFVDRRGDFTVNIALVEGGVPAAGVVFAPARGVLYSGDAGGAFERTVDETGATGERRRISVRRAPAALTVVASRSHRSPDTDAYLADFEIGELVSVGSSLKFCLVASGRADLYPRLGRTMEWDTAAGDAVLRAAGGSTRTLDGTDLAYGKRRQSHDVDFANPSFVARGAES
jgi:3'(2'), 5'-bisphosphate nucleotidase